MDNLSENKKRNRLQISDDQSSHSFGILNLDQVEAFGDESKHFLEEDILKIKPRLQSVREKALKTLEDSKRVGSNFGKRDNRSITDEFVNKNANKSSIQLKSINVSDLVAEDTIVLDSPLKPYQNNCTQKAGDNENKISFEPSEITGRSTIFKQNELSKNNLDFSVDDILASSFCDNVRRLTMTDKKNSIFSSFTSLKTCDLSVDSKCNESFQPGELMASQLLRDELSWENEYAAMPSSAAIAHGIKKRGVEVESDGEKSTKSFVDTSDISEMGNFFHKRSGEIESIINPNILSPPKRNPVKLIGDDGEENLPKKNPNKNSAENNNTQNFRNDRSKDRNVKLKCKSNILTLSAVENRFKEMNINKFLSEGHDTWSKEYLNSKYGESNKSKSNDKAHDIAEKENLCPIKPIDEDDTVSFSESLLDDSNMMAIDKKCSDNKYNINGGSVSKFNENSLRSNISKQIDFENYSTNKHSRSSNRSVRPEPIPVIKSMSSTMLNGQKYDKFLHVESHNLPPLSPIKRKSVTPTKQIGQNYSPPSSLKSPQAKSNGSSESGRSPISLNTTTHSESRYLYAHECKDYDIPSSEIRSHTSRSKSPSNNYAGLIAQQYSAGSLISAKSRCNSQCSTTSEFSHKHGQTLPIKSTVNQCCFGSTKLRNTSKKTVGIRNISMKRLSFKIGIEGPGFQIENMENNTILTLQGQECRSISISFCPTMIGAATGKLNFSPPYEGWPIDKVILLQGFGGHANIKVRDFQKGPVGPPFINMGELQELTQPLTKTFSIYNRGPLNGFAVINLNSTGLTISNLCERIEIEPRQAFLPPDSTFKFRITFRPRRYDIKKILSKITDVMTIANIRIITGDDPTRQRIRNIIEICDRNSSQKEIALPELTQSNLAACWLQLPNEIKHTELSSFVESSENALELAGSFRDWEAVITITHCLMDVTKNTSNICFTDFDETILFRTMICANSESKNLKNSNDGYGDRNLRSNESWEVRPNVLRFDQPRSANKTCFTIKSFFEVDQYFEITSNYKNLFNIHPKEGVLLSGEALDVQVTLLSNDQKNLDNVNIIVFFEKEKFCVPVILKN